MSWTYLTGTIPLPSSNPTLVRQTLLTCLRKRRFMAGSYWTVGHMCYGIFSLWNMIGKGTKETYRSVYCCQRIELLSIVIFKKICMPTARFHMFSFYGLFVGNDHHPTPVHSVVSMHVMKWKYISPYFYSEITTVYLICVYIHVYSAV